jgi:hypothetical protein
MFLIYFTTCFGLTRHHQVYSVCLKSLLYFPFQVSNTSRCFFQVMLRHAWFICNMHQVILMFLYCGYYMLFLLFYYCFSSVTHVCWICCFHVSCCCVCSASFCVFPVSLPPFTCMMYCVRAAIWWSFPVVLWMLRSVRLGLYNSFAGYYCWFCICGVSPVCLSVSLSYVSLWYPLYPVVVPCLCPVFSIWSGYPELLLLFLIACVCALYLVWNSLPVCPIYFVDVVFAVFFSLLVFARY